MLKNLISQQHGTAVDFSILANFGAILSLFSAASYQKIQYLVLK